MQNNDVAALPAKLTPPETARFFPRPELFETMKDLAGAPRKIWVSSPGGAGKTTLVRAFLADDPRPLVWYQVDRGDRDPAALFFYLAQAAQVAGMAGAALPSLSPEYLPNLPIFCRNYFRTFFARFPAGCVLVLDDLQEGPGEEIFGVVLAAAMAELPKGSTLFILSREEPYPCFAKERLNRSLAYLGWKDLRLSMEDTRDFLSWAGAADGPLPDPEQAFELTHGWLAGLLLFLETPERKDPVREFSMARTGLLFDYFAEEIFSRFPEATRNFLLACALPPTVATDLAERLTGQSEAGKILDELARGNHFTFRISTSPEAYRFHPLFRHFLLTRAEKELEKGRLATLREQAARLLMEAGQFEAAADLMIAAGAWPALIELITVQAESLLYQHRSRTLLLWLEALPAEQRAADPWLCYWRGNCLHAMAQDTGREDLASAFELFQERGDAVGSMLAWATGVNAVAVGWNDLKELDAWIVRFDRLRKDFPEYPSPQIEAQVLNSIVTALNWRQPGRADLPEWAEQLHRVVTSSCDSNFRLFAGSNLVFYHVSAGNLAIARSLVELLNGDLHAAEASPLQKLIWLAIRAILEWVLFDRTGCLATLEQGRALVAESGLAQFSQRLYGQGLTMALSSGDLPLVQQLMEKLPTIPVTAALDHSHASLLLADLSLLQGDVPKALHLAELSVKRAKDGGSPIFLAFGLAGQILALYENGQKEAAAGALKKALKVARGMNYFTCHFSLLAAFFALEDGDEKATRRLLRKGFGLAACQGYLNFYPWRDRIMAPLCREAVVAGIEVDYVTRLADLRQLDIAPLDQPTLSPKEIEILTWARAGKTSPEIAMIQGISERTVKFHIGNILRKLDVTSRIQAVAVAMQKGILPQD